MESTKRDNPGRRLAVLAAAVLMMMALGTGQAWATFAKPLKAQHALTDTDTQLIFSTLTLVFCVWMVPAGRLHDRWGPRPLAVASAAMVGLGYGIAWRFGQSFPVLWLAMGVLVGAGVATGYVCPIATAVKWFPHHKGLVCGIAAAGFGLGPVVVSALAEALLAGGWDVLSVFGAVAAAYAPVILVCGLGLVSPVTHPQAEKNPLEGGTRIPLEGGTRIPFEGATRIPLEGGTHHFFRDGRFWLLFVGMLCGTMPYLIVMGNVRLLGESFGIGPLAAMGVTVVAVGNTAGRLFWGYVLDRMGQRRAMLAAQGLMLTAVLCAMLLGSSPAAFLAAAGIIGFCYGSNFAIFPATVASLYGAEAMGAVYPWVMVAQGISSFGSTASGRLHDATGSYLGGLALGTVVIAGGLALTLVLSRRLGLR